jgi:lysine 2,3-aminomutase
MTESDDMTSINQPESNEHSTATAIEDVPPPPAHHPEPDLTHRELRGGEFWRHIPAYRDVDEEQFLDHTWQLRNSVTRIDALLETVGDLISEGFAEDVRGGLAAAPMALRISPYVVSLIDWENAESDPLRQQFLPLRTGLRGDHPELNLDSLGEQGDSPVEGLTHRYPDKALFLALDTCPVYCRYCTRSYAVGLDTEEVEKVSLSPTDRRWSQIFDYIRATPQLEDIVVSGGDTYMLRPPKLRALGETLLKIPHVRRIRFATKGPAIMPMKILTDEDWHTALLDVAEFGRSLHKEVCVHTHFSHPAEITEISRHAMNRLMGDGITVRNQAVLQRGVNDSAETMTLLARRLSHINVQPYYVYMHDLVKGVEDLRTTLQTGIDIEKEVRGTVAGFNTPLFVVDAPGGGGKRDVHSHEHYDRETGISVFTAPSIKPGRHFLYFDPIDTLSEEIQRAWRDPDQRREMKRAAVEAAQRGAL